MAAATPLNVGKMPGPQTSMLRWHLAHYSNFTFSSSEKELRIFHLHEGVQPAEWAFCSRPRIGRPEFAPSILATCIKVKRRIRGHYRPNLRDTTGGVLSITANQCITGIEACFTVIIRFVAGTDARTHLAGRGNSGACSVQIQYKIDKRCHSKRRSGAEQDTVCVVSCFLMKVILVIQEHGASLLVHICTTYIRLDACLSIYPHATILAFFLLSTSYQLQVTNFRFAKYITKSVLS
jgi:hypothetical protein